MPEPSATDACGLPTRPFFLYGPMTIWPRLALTQSQLLWSETSKKEQPMRGGLRIWDADTHKNPAAEGLARYVDPSFRPRLARLTCYRIANGRMSGGTADTHQSRLAARLYPRILGEAGPHETFTGR